MFTGLVDDIGEITAIGPSEIGLDMTVRCSYRDVETGESVAVNGACLTVNAVGPQSFDCAAVWTTLAVTAIGSWTIGRRVNLERAMRPTDRMGGHIVQGHVDGVARVTRVETEGDALIFDLALPAGLSELMVERGSVAVDGVSLTVTGLPAPDVIRLSVIDFTRRHTTLGDLREGGMVHVEADVIAKYVRQMLEPHRHS